MLALGGYIAPASQWAQFSDEWDSLLNQPPRLTRFKMSELAATPSGMARAALFYALIEQYATAAISCVIRTDALVRVVRSTKWPSFVVDTHHLENPFYFGFKAIMSGLALHQMQMGLEEPVDFIFDDQTEYVRALDAWAYLKASTTPEVRRLMGDLPSFKRDECVKPLQAADLYAWWVRKWELDGIADGVSHLRLAWGDEPRYSTTGNVVW